MHTRILFGRLLLQTASCEPLFSIPKCVIPLFSWAGSVGDCFVQTRTKTVGAIRTLGQSKQIVDMMMSISMLTQMFFQQQQLHILSVPARPKGISQIWVPERFVLTAKRSLCLSSLEM